MTPISSRGAAALVAVFVFSACSTAPKQAPFFQFEKIRNHWGLDPDVARLEPVLKASLKERFATKSDAISVPLLDSSMPSHKTPDPDGTTIGLATMNGSAIAVPPKGTGARLDPAVDSLKERGQRALLARGPACDGDCFKATLKAITVPARAAEVNYFRPTYALQLSSDVQTSNPFDRFERLSSLVVISACSRRAAAASQSPLDDALIPCTQDAASIDEAASNRAKKDNLSVLAASKSAAIARTEPDDEGFQTLPVRIESLASIADSELTLVYGKLVEEDASAFKVGANLAALPTAGGTGGASVEYQRSSKDTLTRDLAEKIITTSAYRSAEAALAPVAFWIDQRGNRDHKLRHTLTQSVTFSLNRRYEWAHAVWVLDRSGNAPVLKRQGVRYPDPELNLRAHVFTVGVVRQIKREGGFFSRGTQHTPNEDDDTSVRHAMTDYQRIDLPPWGPKLGGIDIDDPDNPGLDIRIYPPHAGAVGLEADYFSSLSMAQTVVDQLNSATWTDSRRGANGVEQHAHAELLGVKVAVVGLNTANEVTDRLKHIYSFEY